MSELAEPAVTLPTERVALADLRPHPRNYRIHPADQLAHIEASLAEHGQYRNVVIARDGTILAGHGVAEAAVNLGWTELTVIRLDVEADEPAALKVLTGDNEMGRLAEVNDRLLTEHLKALAELDTLVGTGFDEQMLANLVFVTRPASELGTRDDAAQWVGMPDFGQTEAPHRIVVSFDNESDRAAFMETLGIDVIHKKTNGTWSMWWPPRAKEDLSSVRFETEDAAA